MKKIKVKIINQRPGVWYHNKAGDIITVTIYDQNPNFYLFFTLNKKDIVIPTGDCEVIEEEATQPEPFDIDKALRGGEVVTRSGLPVKIKQVMKSHAGNKVHAMVEDGLLTMHCVFSEDGNFDPLTEHKLDLFMAPKEPEYLEGWVIVDKYGIAPCVYPDVKSASHSAVFNNADRKFKIEKIRFPKP